MKTKAHPLTALSLALLAGLIVFASPHAHGQINYQGRLTDATGAPLPDGPEVVVFYLYGAVSGGTPLWGPYVLDGVPGVGHGPQPDLVDGGRFNAVIGNLDTASRSLTTTMATSATHYLEIRVGGSAPADAITPRQVILAAPRALKADVIPNVTPNGSNVGIGTASAKDSLHIYGATPEIRISNTDETYSGIAFEDSGAPEDGTGVTPLQFAAIRYSSGDGNLGFFNVDPVTPKVVIKNTGRVGIGATNPAYPLEIRSDTEAQLALSTSPSLGPFPQVGPRRKTLRLSYDEAADFGQIVSFHEGNVLKDLILTVANVGIGTETPTQKLDVVGNATISGIVGIGTTTPTQAKLVVSGGVAGTVNIGGFLNRDGASDLTNSNQDRDYGIYCTNVIVGSEIFANSDARIKNIDGRSEGVADLATLLQFEVTDYHYIDTLTKGNHSQKKLIAQQVESVYPQAVGRHTDVVPDIYERAPISAGWVQLTTDLKVGERVRLIGEKEESIEEVLGVREGAFRTAFAPDSDEVFVYGREVKDFRAVDYEAIAMLNVSATQELARQLKASQEKYATLQEENAGLKAELAQQAAKDQAIEARLARLEKSTPKAAGTMQVSLKK